MKSYLNIHEKKLKHFKEDIQYFTEHKDELTEKYPDKWVGVYHHNVVSANKDLKTLIDNLVKQGISPGKTVVEYLATRETIMIL